MKPATMQAAFCSFRMSVLVALATAGLAVSCGSDGNTSAAMTTVDATSMLQDNVTPNVTEIRVVGTDTEGHVVSSQTHPKASCCDL